MRKVVLLLMAVAMVFTSCDTKKHKKAKVTSYRVANTATADPNDWLYYYLIFNNHSNSYYYYSSPTPVTSFAGTSWTTSSTIPAELNGQTPIDEFEEPLTELPDEIEVEMDEAIDAEADADSDGGGGQVEGEDDGDGDSGDASDGDSGGGDSGGGDGGGDGGGGGE